MSALQGADLTLWAQAWAQSAPWKPEKGAKLQLMRWKRFVQGDEDAWLAKGGVAHDGEVATRLGLPGIPAFAETIALGTLLELVRATGARVHVCRLSTAGISAKNGGRGSSVLNGTDVLVVLPVSAINPRILYCPLIAWRGELFESPDDVYRAIVLQRLPSSGGGLNSKFNNSGNFGNPPDGEPPDTQYTGGPVQDRIARSLAEQEAARLMLDKLRP